MTEEHREAAAEVEGEGGGKGEGRGGEAWATGKRRAQGRTVKAAAETALLSGAGTLAARPPGPPCAPLTPVSFDWPCSRLAKKMLTSAWEWQRHLT